MGEINFELLDATETSDEDLEAETFKQDEIEIDLKIVDEKLSKVVYRTYI